MAACAVRNRKARVNKNKKKSWRKHVDIKEVEDYLEEKRVEEKTGGPVSEKPDEALFYLHKKNNPQENPGKEKSWKKPLRCHDILLPNSAVVPPIKPCQRRFVSGKKNRLRALRKASNLKKKKKYHEERTTKEPQLNRQVSDPDIWKDDESNVKEEDFVTYYNEITRKRTPKIPNHHYQKPSLLPPIEVPHPGASYNPAFDEHQELLQEALTKEMKHEHEDKKLQRALKVNLCEPEFLQKMWLSEMSQGLDDVVDEPEDDTVEEQLKSSYIRPEVRKTKSKRRREKERKLQKKKSDEEKLKRKRDHEVYRLRSIKRDISSSEEMSKARQQRKQQMLAGKMYRPLRLGRYKFQEQDLELNLTEELTGSLRSVKVDGNILEDRYKSFQKRNIIEPRVRQKMKRKYKLKRLEKRSHRDFK
ncbi:ribosome biogenesis protein NOP53-like isoform X2 [Limulus polyphemus]|uniref:Ribosome biogenesis protein NOP53 n=1 Tax=Limulus polyphemus TaxID=6850 RepID=A0ABM1BX60_LIMPO|nr:ribosome biogenesis protein NOP53-like isoform X2 [Limulus polyphemus]